MRSLTPLLILIGILTASPGATGASAQPQGAVPYHTHNDRFTVPEYTSAADWQRRAAYLREHILASAGLLPMPEKTPLRAQVFDERRHEGYSVFKVYFESLPGFYVTGNLYRPAGAGPFPAILSPHGHWVYGRLENTALASVPGRAINLAQQGFVVFTYDMIGYNDSRQLAHDFGGKRETLWGLSLAGLLTKRDRAALSVNRRFTTHVTAGASLQWVRNEDLLQQPGIAFAKVDYGRVDLNLNWRLSEHWSLAFSVGGAASRDHRLDTEADNYNALLGIIWTGRQQSL